jgi:23S rRNA-/tRNA-specific pseudouridylate synthase
VEGRPSATQIEVREKFQSCFLAKVRPLTGRRHQIRIHLSTAGYPICGDALYGGPAELDLTPSHSKVVFQRVALHAASLELPTGEKFVAPWPKDFEMWMDLLRGTERVE